MNLCECYAKFPGGVRWKITPQGVEVDGAGLIQSDDTFLRYRPAEDLPTPIRQTADSRPLPAILPRVDSPTGETPIGETPIGEIANHGRIAPAAEDQVYQEDESPIGHTPIGNRSCDSLLDPSSVPVIRPPRKIRRAVKVQDAHSSGEQALYQALWNTGIVETPDAKLIRIGYGGMQSLCGLDRSNCKDNILSLIKKLAIEVISGFDIRRNQGNTYRVFSYGAILKRRKAAGLEWVIRSRGVQFVPQPPIGETPIGNNDEPIGDLPILSFWPCIAISSHPGYPRVPACRGRHDLITG
jgi:hypothetical protein